MRLLENLVQIYMKKKMIYLCNQLSRVTKKEIVIESDDIFACLASKTNLTNNREGSIYINNVEIVKQKQVVKNCEIEMLLTDCDGCLTDGGMYYSEYGDEQKKFNAKDGMAFSLIREKGLAIGIITSEDVKLNERRAKKLKLDIYEKGCKDKLKCVIEVCKQRGISLNRVGYVGDDINDIELLKAVGFSACPADALEDVKEIVDYVSTFKGGEGVIRDIYEKFFAN